MCVCVCVHGVYRPVVELQLGGHEHEPRPVHVLGVHQLHHRGASGHVQH